MKRIQFPYRNYTFRFQNGHIKEKEIKNKTFPNSLKVFGKQENRVFAAFISVSKIGQESVESHEIKAPREYNFL